MNDDEMNLWLENLDNLNFQPVATPAPKKILQLEDIAPKPTVSNDQMAFVDLQEPWRAEWQNMPEFHQVNLAPYKTLYVHFDCREDVLAFFNLINIPYSPDCQWVWYPDRDPELFADKRWVDSEGAFAKLSAICPACQSEPCTCGQEVQP